jgi:hypothetical protein
MRIAPAETKPSIISGRKVLLADSSRSDQAHAKQSRGPSDEFLVGEVTDKAAALVRDLYHNEALAGDLFFVHGGLHPSSKG